MTPPEPEPIPDSEKGRELAERIRQADKAYDDMYESRNPAGPYSDMKDFMRDAIVLARELGLVERVRQLEETLAHRKAVFRSQMS